MACDEEPEDFFLGREPRVLVPVRNVGKAIIGGLRLFLLKHSKQAVLAGFGVALSLLRLLHGFVKNGHELCAASERIHGAALDQRFKHALVKKAKVDVLAELEDRGEAAQFFSRGDNRFDGIAPDVLYRSQSEADIFAVRGEVGVGDVDIWRLDRNPHLPAFVDVLDHVVG